LLLLKKINRGENFQLPHVERHQYRYGNDRWYLAYTPELWEGLKELLATIERAREKIFDLLDSPDVEQTISQVGAEVLKMLSSGTEDV
ncbi:unnamed protein product, partial [marine sediment metagenome]